MGGTPLFLSEPQVHAFDDESVMANASGQFDAVRARRSLRPARVGLPVTLRPRFNPDATGSVEPLSRIPGRNCRSALRGPWRA